MVTVSREAPSSRPSDLPFRDGLIIGGANMRNEHLEVYWNCQIWRRQRGVYVVTCLKADHEGVYYGRLLHLKTLLREHGKHHDMDPEDPCRLAEDLRVATNSKSEE